MYVMLAAGKEIETPATAQRLFPRERYALSETHGSSRKAHQRGEI